MMKQSLIALCIGCGIFSASSVFPASITGCQAAGINIEGPRYYATDNEFTDIAKLSNMWVRPYGSPYQNIPLNLDANGYPTSIDAGGAQVIVSLDLWGRDLVSDRDYVLLYDGEGTLTPNLAGGTNIVVSQAPGRMVVRLKAGNLGLLETATNPANYIRNIRIIPLAQEQNYLANPFRQAYINRWGQFPVWRFMDALQTNNSTEVDWSDAPTQTEFGASQGMSYADAVSLANTANVSPWLNIPHMATDDYITQMATYVKANLRRNLKVYIEYSNETWNGIFSQSAYTQAQATAIGGLDKYQFYAKRSVEAFAIWERVFGSARRIVRVVGTQFGNPWITQRTLSYLDTAKHVDALAVGYYVGIQLGSPSIVDQTLALSVSDNLAVLRNTYLPVAKTLLAQHKAYANQYNVPMIAYEAGQHLVGNGTHPVYGNLQNYQPLTDKLIAINRSPGMFGFYQDLYSAWVQAGGGLINWYSSSGAFSKFGSWGLLENASQDPQAAPKYRSVMQMVGQESQPSIDACRYVQ